MSDVKVTLHVEGAEAVNSAIDAIAKKASEMKLDYFIEMAKVMAASGIARIRIDEIEIELSPAAFVPFVSQTPAP